jgi:hypothetical protein
MAEGFLDAGMAGLKRRPVDPGEQDTAKQTQTKVGELTMRLELAQLLLEKMGMRKDRRLVAG